MQFVGSASTAAILRALLDTLGHARPDVVLVALDLPEDDGPGTTATIRAAYPHARMLTYTEDPAHPLAARALAAGAAAVLTERTLPTRRTPRLPSAELITADRRAASTATRGTPGVIAPAATESAPSRAPHQAPAGTPTAAAAGGHTATPSTPFAISRSDQPTDEEIDRQTLTVEADEPDAPGRGAPDGALQDAARVGVIRQGSAMRAEQSVHTVIRADARVRRLRRGRDRLVPAPRRGGVADPTGDVDLLVPASDLPRLDAVVAAEGFLRVHARGAHRGYVGYDAETDRFLELAIESDLDFGSSGHFAVNRLPPILRTNTAAAVLARRRRLGPLTVPDPDDAFWALLLHCVIDKRTIAPRHRARLTELAPQARPDDVLRSVVSAPTVHRDGTPTDARGSLRGSVVRARDPRRADESPPPDARCEPTPSPESGTLCWPDGRDGDEP